MPDARERSGTLVRHAHRVARIARSVSNHPGPRGAVPVPGLAMTMAASVAADMSILLVSGSCPCFHDRLICASLVDAVRLARDAVHQGERRSGDRTRGRHAASRTWRRRIRLGSWEAKNRILRVTGKNSYKGVPPRRNGQIVLDHPFLSPDDDAAGARARPAPLPAACFQRPAASAPETILVGPFAFGRMSNSNISVGIARVQQALGISTIPLMRPSTGAVPKIM